MIFVDGGNNRIGIGIGTPLNKFQINHPGQDGDNGLMIVRSDDSTADGDLLGGIGFDSTDGNVPSSVLEASAFIVAKAAEDHSTGDKGGDLIFGASKINENDDTVSTEHMRIDANGHVGIGVNDAVDPLQVLCDADGHGLTLEENSGGETYTIGVDSSGDLNFYNSATTTPTMKLDDNGDLGIGTGTSNPPYRLTVRGNNNAISASGFFRYSNHMTINSGTPLWRLSRHGDNGSNNDGALIKYHSFNNTDNLPGAQERFINFGVIDTAGGGSTDYIGSVVGDTDGGVNYISDFTGKHSAPIISGSYEIGMIVESTGEVWAKGALHTGLPKVQVSTTDSSKTVYGVIDNFESLQTGYKSRWGIANNELHIDVCALGEGNILVTNKNGNVENGDYIVSSVIVGYGQKQNDDIFRSSTVAKCTETIDWDNVTDTITHNGVEYKKYLTTCTYHCG